MTLAVIKRGHNEECVKVLSDLLKRAEAGEVIGFVAAVQYAASKNFGFVRTSIDDAMTCVGFLDRMKFDLHQEMKAEDVRAK